MAHRRGWEREGLAHGRRGYDSEGRAGHGGPLSHTRCLGDVTASGGRIPLGLQGRHGSHGADMAGTHGHLLDRLELMTYSKGHQRPPKATRCVLKCGGPFPYSLAGTWVHNKSFKTVTGMSELLVRDRGLVCSDIDELKRFLSRVNYYRFSGYAREFQRDPKCGNNDFITGSSFQTIVGLMQADSKLRHLLLEQLGVIEMAIRARLAHECGRVYGSSAYYLDVGRYSCHKKGSNQGAINPTNIVKGILSDLERDKSRMVEHYIDSSVAGNDLKSRCQRYRNVPIWVAVEVLSFGRISKMITYSRNTSPIKCVTQSLGVQWGPFAQVVHSLSVLRNLCAHHRQLWNRGLDIRCPVQRKLRPRTIQFTDDSPYAHIIMANHYRKKIDADESIANQISDLLDKNAQFAEGIYRPNPK